MRLIWERMKIIVEPSAAVTLAALMQIRHIGTKAERHKVGIILSGGNVDLERLPWSENIGTEAQSRGSALKTK